MIFITKAWHSRGQRFDPAYLHQIGHPKYGKILKTLSFQNFFLLFCSEYPFKIGSRWLISHLLDLLYFT